MLPFLRRVLPGFLYAKPGNFPLLLPCPDPAAAAGARWHAPHTDELVAHRG